MIQMGQVSYTYPGETRAALDRVTAVFQPGVVSLVAGPLGAGCSTLLLAAAGLVPHVTGGTRRGTVITLGVDPASTDGRRKLAGRIGILLSAPWTQLSGMAATVADEIAFGPANHGWQRERIAGAVENAMERVGIGHLAARDPETLSGGELQRVILAGVMAMDPEIYLLDEPAQELDPAAASSLYRLLPRLAEHATVLVASTDLDRVADVADRVFLLRDGRCVADGVPADVLGTDDAVAARSSTTIAEIARAAGWPAPFPLTIPAALRRMVP